MVGLGLVASGCMETADEEYGETMSAVSVSTYTASGCSTSVVLGLSKQIADEIGCMSANSLVRFTPSAKIQVTSNAVLPYLSATGRSALLNVSGTVQINSAFRTVAQQYLLYRWKQQGRCGITAAAAPGDSNHESGRALDLSNWSSKVGGMSAQGWAHDVPGDPVHFDHLGSPDLRGRDVLAFQRLWNRNNPDSPIAEDGAYGPQTESKLRQAPATGFPHGAMCVTRALGAEVVSVQGPDKIAPGEHAHYAVTVDNTGGADWPATTRVLVSGGGSSELYDDATWTSASEVGPLGAAISAGGQGIIDIEIVGPMVDVETPASTQFTLSDSGSDVGTFHVSMMITPNGDEGTSGDADDENDGATVSGGCNASGTGGWVAILIPALGLLHRRRRS